MTSLKTRLPQPGDGPLPTTALADEDRQRQFISAINATVAELCKRTGMPASEVNVLHVGAGCFGVLPLASIRAGARVIVVDVDERACKEVHANCAGEAIEGQLTIERVHSMRHVTDTKYDVVVSDVFGPSITDKGYFVCAHDLRARGLVRTHPQFDNEPLFVPAEATMLLTVYQCPALSVKNWAMHYDPRINKVFMHVASTGAGPKEEGEVQLKFQHDRGPSGIRFDASICSPVCAPVCVASACFGSTDAPLVRESGAVIHVDTSKLDPSQHMSPSHSYIAVLEWGLDMVSFPEHGVEMVGNAINLMDNLKGNDRLARWTSWGHLYSPMPVPVDATVPLRVKTNFKTNGDVSVALTPLDPGQDVKPKIETVSFALARLDKLSEKMFLAC